MACSSGRGGSCSLLRGVGKGLVGLVAVVVVAILVMFVAMLMMNAVAPTRDTTVPAVGVGIAIVAIAGLAITWKYGVDSPPKCMNEAQRVASPTTR